MSELRAGAKVMGSDGELGTVDALIIDPTIPAVTHLVVSRERLAPRVLVGAEHITSSDAEQVVVDLSAATADDCVRFDEPAFNVPGEPGSYAGAELDPGTYFLEPYATPLDGWPLTEHERIPKGDVSIRRHDEVFSSDGTKVGHVDEFLVDPSDGHITHVVLRQGHVFRHDDDVVIPVQSATSFEEGRVVLGIDLEAVESLPKVPVQRHRHVSG